MNICILREAPCGFLTMPEWAESLQHMNFHGQGTAGRCRKCPLWGHSRSTRSLSQSLLWDAAREPQPFAFRREVPVAMMSKVTCQHPHPHTFNSPVPPGHWMAVLGQFLVMAFIDSPRPWRFSEDCTPRTLICCHSWHWLSAWTVSVRQKENQHSLVL